MGTHTGHKDFGTSAVNSAELISELLKSEQRSCVPGAGEVALPDSSALTHTCLSLG